MALENAMDTDKVRDIASQLSTEAGRIGEVATNGNSQAGTLAENWLGNDSDQFQADWQNAAKQLQAAQDALVTYSKRATSNADAQDKQSGKAGG